MDPVHSIAAGGPVSPGHPGSRGRPVAGRCGPRGPARFLAACAILALALGSLASPVFPAVAWAGPQDVAARYPSGRPLATPQDDQSRINAELAQVHALLEGATDRARQAAVAYTEATGALPAAQDRLAVAEGGVAAATVAARAARRQEASARAAAAAAAAAYQSAAERVGQQRQRVGELTSAAYKGSGVLALASLVDASGPAEVAERLGYLQFIARGQRQTLNGFVAARQLARTAAATAEAARRAAEQALAASDQALAGAQAARDSARQAADRVAALVLSRDRAVVAANAERAATLARYQELQRESERVAAQIRAAAAPDQRRSPPGVSTIAAPTYRGGYFLMPVDGWKSSDFGMRFDPYYQVWQLHAGVDLAAPGGTPIYAAGDGQVLRAGWNGGYGNYTCVYHGLYRGQGLATCYAHQSEILVSAGQWVRRGQLIGRVGTTGASTGYHLHFEVRVDGTPVQPLTWLPSCLC